MHMTADTRSKSKTEKCIYRLRNRKNSLLSEGSKSPGCSFFEEKSRWALKIKSKKNKPDSTLLKAKKNLIELGITNLDARNYISSSKDQPRLVKVKPLNLLKSTKAFALFAKQDIPKGTCIGEYTGNRYAVSDFKKLLADDALDDKYAMNMGTEVIDAMEAGNFTRYINFSDSQANVEFQGMKLRGEKIAAVVTKKAISVGQQLLVDYNVYDPAASGSYYFLNPQDNWQSTREFYQEHKGDYSFLSSPISLQHLGLAAADPLYVTELARSVINHQVIDGSAVLNGQVNWPFLKLSKKMEILDATETDLYTPLMMACYTGQRENVNWLINHGANVDQQQNHSGYCPLFFSLQGYSEQVGNRDDYVEIIKMLIENKANVRAHDRADRTFLHKAASILTAQDFKAIMELLSVNIDSMEELYNYIDTNELDIFMHCLQHHFTEHAVILLTFYPNYIQQSFYHGTQYQREFNKAKFKTVMDSYSNEEKTALLRLMEQDSLLNDDLKQELGFEVGSAMRMMS